MKVTVLNNQSLLDIATQTTGLPSNYIKIAVANSISPTAFLDAGMELIIPEDLEKDDDIVRYYLANGILPATAHNSLVARESLGGIGNMKIGTTFKVR